jgi:hypothetical protein
MTYRVEVRDGTRRDTLNDVLEPLPIVVGDSLIMGLRLNRDHAARVLFRFRVSSSALEVWSLPSDVWDVYHDIVVSPNGQYFAYVGMGDSGTVAVVREVGTNVEIARGASGGGCECDVDLNHARWFAPDSFEIAVAHTHTDPGGWKLVAGRASERRASVSTLRQEPEWHR